MLLTRSEITGGIPVYNLMIPPPPNHQVERKNAPPGQAAGVPQIGGGPSKPVETVGKAGINTD